MFDHVNAEKAAKIFFGCTPEDICPVCLFTWSYTPYLEQFTDVVEFGGWRKGFSGTYNGQRISVIVPGMGATAAGDAVVFLKYLNCQRIVYAGAAGGFGECELGDIIVPTRAVIGEGFSQYYTKMKESLPNEDLLKIAKKRFSEKKIHYRPIFTIGSIGAQKRNLLLQLEKKGIGCIDIETSAIFTASSHSNISCIAIHYISDLPLKRSLLDFFSTDELRNITRGYKTTINMALELTQYLSE